MDNKRLTEKEAAALIGIAYSHLGNLRHSNKGPAYLRFGKRVMYETADIDTWIASCKQSGSVNIECTTPDVTTSDLPDPL